MSARGGKTGETRATPSQRGGRHAKATLPSKICAHCRRPFAWRRKWARDWAEVKFCSERCRRGG